MYCFIVVKCLSLLTFELVQFSRLDWEIKFFYSVLFSSSSLDNIPFYGFPTVLMTENFLKWINKFATNPSNQI